MADSKATPHNKLHGFVTRSLSLRSRGRPQSSSAKLAIPVDSTASTSLDELTDSVNSPPLSKEPGGRSLSSSARPARISIASVPQERSTSPASPPVRSPLTFGRSKLSNLLGEGTSRSRSRSHAHSSSLALADEETAGVRRTHSVTRQGKTDTTRTRNQRSHLGRLANASRSYDSLTSSALPSAQASPTQPSAPLSPRKPTISSTHRAQPSRSFSPLPLSPFDPAGHRQWAPISPPAGTKELDPLKNVHDHMKAKQELMGPGPFYSVQRGWTKGVYTSRNEAERQIRNFPGPLMQAFDDVDEALSFLSAPANPAPASWASPFDDDEADGVRPGTPSHAKAVAENAEHKTQVQKIIDEAAKAEKKAKADKRASLRSLPDLLNFAGASGLDHWAALQNIKPGLWGAQIATSASILLPVRSVANSIAFYTLVLGFREVSNYENMHAVVEGGAPEALRGPRIVLRSLEAAPSGHGLGASNSIKGIINGGRNRSGSIQRVLAASSSSSSATSTPPSSDPAQSTLPLREVQKLHPPATAMGTSFDHDSIAKQAPPPPPPRHGGPALSGMCVFLEYGGQLDSLREEFEEHLGGENGDKVVGTHKWEGAKVSGAIETKPWGTRELSIIDPDGHRLIFSSSTESKSDSNNELGVYEELTDQPDPKERLGSNHRSPSTENGNGGKAAVERGRKRLSLMRAPASDSDHSPIEGGGALNGILEYQPRLDGSTTLSPIPVSAVETPNTPDAPWHT